MFFSKSSTVWIIAGSSLLLLGASYASSMHSWVNQQPRAQSAAPVVIPTSSAMTLVSTRPLPVTLPPSDSSSQALSEAAIVAPSKSPAPQILQESAQSQQPEISVRSPVSLVDSVPSQAKSLSTPMVSIDEISGVAEAATPPEQVPPTIMTHTVPMTPSVQRPQQIQAHAYEDEIIVEFPAQLARTTQIKKALSTIMLADVSLEQMDLLKPAKFNTQNEPYYFKRVRDKSNFSIRYPAQAYEYAKVLLNENAYWVADEAQQFLHVRIPLHSPDAPLASLLRQAPNAKQSLSLTVPNEVEQYRRWAQHYAQAYKVPVDMVLAVMQVESAFNPQARSRSNALGLMQIKAEAAGRDVFTLIDGHNRAPSEEELLNPQNNIRIGAAYLSLLDQHYFGDVSDAKKRELLVISAYNAGLNTVLKLFANTPKAALEKINQLTVQQLYQRLQSQHETQEAREYVDRVLNARQQLS
ncbi:hypothetical protein THMIRHAS_08890 [Thiosulfatimonas sediminis]|uniref:Transglycosylase SLT domain-containing protein n=1 Tax=Thiosulfatimonas sediminis TaxID=2675054 RepID=A0A6F8PTT9_9GAMM|nr:murein transglycosylase domain-containing protein [Thiosulfatimonas sediminis]BBP45516.1 hypothetical protein THMIRHAS_08890 [Thiosulfatimonas sediminis]